MNKSRSNSRTSSMVLRKQTKEKSRKTSKNEIQGLWLESEFLSKKENPLLNKSYEELSEEKE